jgi:hypothetical protein
MTETKRRRSRISLGVLAGLVLLAVSGAWWPAMGGVVAEEPTQELLPLDRFTPEQLERWRSAKTALEKEYGVCLEHCGRSSQCEQRCRQVRDERLRGQRERIQAGP